MSYKETDETKKELNDFLNSISAEAEELFAIGVGVKHITNRQSIQFVVSDREELEIIHEENRLIVESDPLRVRYYLDIFEDLWKHATDAQKRILELKTANS